MTAKIVTTEDGSFSVFVEELDEYYHSVHGALQESVHVFIEAGLRTKIHRQDEISILEIGFGTGLNALLTCLEASTHRQKINYTAIEKFPLPQMVFSKLNYCSLLQEKKCGLLFSDIHTCEWQLQQPISDYFQLTKYQMNIEEINFSQQFDIIYFDAFAPTAQPELWTTAIFQAMYNALKQDGILVTYCAKGIVKRTMKSVGFIIEALPGPKGKREMTRAIKI